MVWAFTELMIEGGEPAIIQWLRQENEAAQRGDHPLLRAAPPSPQVKMLAPLGVSHAYLMSGRAVAIPADRLVEMSEDDAKPLERAGWLRAATLLPAF